MKWSVDRGRWSVAAIPATLTFAAVSYPFLLASGAALSALTVHTFFSHICHQIPERSFFLFGAPLAVCSRCMGIYAGAALGAFVRGPRGLIVKVLWASLALNLLEAAMEYAGLHGNWLALRGLLGLVLGLAASALVAQATLEARQAKLHAADR